MSRRFVIVLLSIIYFTSCGTKQEPKTIKVRGSESLHEAFNALARDFNAAHEDIRITVEGGGSRTGLMGVIQDEVDLGMASFDFSLDSLFGSDHGLGTFPLAVDGIVLLHNSSNPIVNLGREQVNGLYTGAISNWAEIGGPDQPVFAVSRDSNSGTQQFFEEFFGMNQDAMKATVAEDNSTIVRLIKDSAGGIGFVGFAYFSSDLKDVHLPTAMTGDTSYVAPTPPNLLNDTYPLKRSLHLYYDESDAETLQIVFNYLKSSRAKGIIENYGLIPIW